jgi:hypothetical protein
LKRQSKPPAVPLTLPVIAEKLRLALVNPLLSGRSSEQYWFVPDITSKQDPLLSILESPKRFEFIASRRSFILSCLKGIEDNSYKTMNILVERKLVNFVKLVESFCADEYSFVNVSTVLAPFAAFLTHTKVIVSPYETLANTVYATVNTHFAELLIQFNKFFLELMPRVRANSWPAVFSEISSLNFGPIVVSQIVLPFLELIRILCLKFVANCYSDHLKMFIKTAEDCLQQWDQLVASGSIYSHIPQLKGIENEFNVKIARKILSQLASIAEVHLITTEDTNVKEKDAQIEVFTWNGPPVTPPESQDRNEYEDIREIRAIPTEQELLAKFPPVLPGNHLFSDGAHWLPPGPQRLIDTHFRLLREDTLRAFRGSIRNVVSWARFKSTKLDDFHDPNIALYFDPRLTGLTYDGSVGVLFVFSIDKTRKSSANLLRSGTLVAFINLGYSGDCKVLIGSIEERPRFGAEQKSGRMNKTPTNGTEDMSATTVLISFAAKDVHIIASWFAGKKPKGHAYLVEAKNIFLPAVLPVFEALQSAEPTELPFQK